MLALSIFDLWRPPMSGKSILTSAVVALVVVIGYDMYKKRQGA